MHRHYRWLQRLAPLAACVCYAVWVHISPEPASLLRAWVPPTDPSLYALEAAERASGTSFVYAGVALHGATRENVRALYQRLNGTAIPHLQFVRTFFEHAPRMLPERNPVFHAWATGAATPVPPPCTAYFGSAIEADRADILWLDLSGFVEPLQAGWSAALGAWCEEGSFSHCEVWGDVQRAPAVAALRAGTLLCVCAVLLLQWALLRRSASRHFWLAQSTVVLVVAAVSRPNSGSGSALVLPFCLLWANAGAAARQGGPQLHGLLPASFAAMAVADAAAAAPRAHAAAIVPGLLAGAVCACLASGHQVHAPPPKSQPALLRPAPAAGAFAAALLCCALLSGSVRTAGVHGALLPSIGPLQARSPHTVWLSSPSSAQAQLRAAAAVRAAIAATPGLGLAACSDAWGGDVAHPAVRRPVLADDPAAHRVWREFEARARTAPTTAAALFSPELLRAAAATPLRISELRTVLLLRSLATFGVVCFVAVRTACAVLVYQTSNDALVLAIAVLTGTPVDYPALFVLVVGGGIAASVFTVRFPRQGVPYSHLERYAALAVLPPVWTLAVHQPALQRAAVMLTSSLVAPELVASAMGHFLVRAEAGAKHVF